MVSIVLNLFPPPPVTPSSSPPSHVLQFTIPALLRMKNFGDAEIAVMKAFHLVFDEEESGRTTLRIIGVDHLNNAAYENHVVRRLRNVVSIQLERIWERQTSKSVEFFLDPLLNSGNDGDGDEEDDAIDNAMNDNPNTITPLVPDSIAILCSSILEKPPLHGAGAGASHSPPPKPPSKAQGEEANIFTRSSNFTRSNLLSVVLPPSPDSERNIKNRLISDPLYSPQIMQYFLGPILYSSQLSKILGRPSSVQSKTVVGGILITGPTGSGKSTLAFDLAENVRRNIGNSKTTVLECNCAGLISSEMGSTERSVKRVFSECRRLTSVGQDVVLILENIETVCRTRDDGDSTKGGTMGRVLAQFLIEIDGGVEITRRKKKKGEAMGCSSNTTSASEVPGVRVGKIAIVGVAQDASQLDSAVIRSGRLGGIVNLTSPSSKERIEIVRDELTKISPEVIGDDIDIEGDKGTFWKYVVEKTDGKSRTFCKNLCSHAGRLAIQDYTATKDDKEGELDVDATFLQLRHFQAILENDL